MENVEVCMQKISYNLESTKHRQLLTPCNYFEGQSIIIGRGLGGFYDVNFYTKRGKAFPTLFAKGWREYLQW